MITPASTSDSELHHWMGVALDTAKRGVECGEFPFGAAVYEPGGTLIAKACNQVRSTCNPSSHAEVNAIAAAASQVGESDLSPYWLVSTAEPCPMCLGAIALAGIQYVAYGASHAVVKESGYGSLGVSGRELAQQFSSQLFVRGPIRGNECVSFMLNNRKRDLLKRELSSHDHSNSRSSA